MHVLCRHRVLEHGLLAMLRQAVSWRTCCCCCDMTLLGLPRLMLPEELVDRLLVRVSRVLLLRMRSDSRCIIASIPFARPRAAADRRGTPLPPAAG